MPPTNTTKPADMSGVDPSPVILKIHRTLFGLLFIYTPALLLVAAVAILYGFLSQEYLTQLSDDSRGFIHAGLFMSGMIGALILAIATFVYRQNRIYVSDHEVTQHVRATLFSRKESRLQLADVEDVNVEQRGILQTIFNYGTLTIETAGAVDNFIFIFCPNPNYYAQAIQQARGTYINKKPATT